MPNQPRMPARIARIRARLFHVYFRFARGLTMGAQACILDDRQQVFLIRHTYISGWHFPGGGVETGETIHEALARELHEEGNILLNQPPQLFGLFFNRKMSRRDHIALFIVRDFSQSAPRLPDREIAEARFFSLDELPATLNSSTRQRLNEILKNQPPSDIW
eukprot:gene13465-13580_t